MCFTSSWGCAYRSGQTLFSWVHSRLKIPSPVLSNVQMQQRLYEVGDKPKSFVGSQEWIGSVEIAILLHELYGIKCELLMLPKCCPSESLQKVALKLVYHFSTSGAPVMCGGSSGRAITILGVYVVEYSKKQDVYLLVLDPHYSGLDDLERIQHSPWCYWGAATSVLSKTHSHNLVLANSPTQKELDFPERFCTNKALGSVQSTGKGVKTEWIFEETDSDSD